MNKHVLDTSRSPVKRLARLEPSRNTPGAPKPITISAVICYHLRSDNDMFSLEIYFISSSTSQTVLFMEQRSAESRQWRAGSGSEAKTPKMVQKKKT